MAKLLIIGNGMATSYLLADLAKQDCRIYDITVVSAEPEPAAYNRILLSSLLAGEKTLDELWMQEQSWYDTQGIKLISNTLVESLDLVAREARLSSSETLAFDILVFATGSRAHIPDMAGAKLDGVMSFRSVTDVETMTEASQSKSHAVVVGGGLLGLEAAHGLQKLGMQVSVVHRRGHLMNRQLDFSAGQLLRKQLEARGITFHLNASLVAIAGDGGVETVRLNNGDLISCDLLLFAAGIDPNKELAEQSGVQTRRGILVDNQMRTSRAGIFALGECCECQGRTFGLVAPVRQQAEVLAGVLMGKDDSFEYCDTPVHLKVSGIEMHSNGELDDRGCDALIAEDSDAGVYRRLLIREDRLVGSVLLGDKTGGSWYDELIATAASIGAMRKKLMFGHRPSS